MALRVAKVFSLLALACSGMAVAQDKPLPNYHKTTGIVGNLLSVGSDTLAGMTTLWVEEFKSIYPEPGWVEIDPHGKLFIPDMKCYLKRPPNASKKL